MRLAFISPFGFIPKATLSHRILPTAKALKKKGHEVVIVIPPYTNPEDSGRIEARDGVRTVNITLPGPAPIPWCGVLRIGLRLAREVKRFEPEKVFIFKPKGYSALAGMMLWLMGKRYPLYLDADDLESDRDMERRMGYKWYERWFFRYQERWLLKRVVALTAASNYLRKYYEEKIGREKVHYLPNGPRDLVPEMPAFHGANSSGKAIFLQKKLGLYGKRIVLLYTRFTECSLKDIIDFLTLFSERYSKGILLIVGEGYARESEILKARFEKMGLSRSVHFTGWVRGEELKDYLSLGEVAIYPMSDTDFNRAKCSAKLIELMVMGKPVVASPVGEVSTYIRDGETGLLAKDAGEMVEGVIGLLEDREKARKIGEGARHFLCENFNWDKLISAQTQFNCFLG